MSRPLRIDFPGAWHHVMNRGARKEPIFASASDAHLFLDLVGETRERFRVETHAFCLMTNHYHLLVRSTDGTLSKAMQHIDGVYSQRVNQRHGHDGPLFRGRFHSILVDSDRYLAAVVAYIHRNPLEANIIENLGDYRWSSYPGYLGLTRPLPWLATDFVNATFSSATELRHHTERLPPDEEVEHFYAQKRLSPVLGDRAFRAAALAQSTTCSETEPHRNHVDNIISVNEIATEVAGVFSVSLESVVRPSPGRRNVPRLVAIVVAADVTGRATRDIGPFFGLTNSSSIDSARASLKKHVVTHPDIVDVIAGLSRRFSAGGTSHYLREFRPDP